MNNLDQDNIIGDIQSNQKDYLPTYKNQYQKKQKQQQIKPNNFNSQSLINKPTYQESTSSIIKQIQMQSQQDYELLQIKQRVKLNIDYIKLPIDQLKIQKGKIILKFFKKNKDKLKKHGLNLENQPDNIYDLRIQNCMLKYYEYKTRFQDEQAEQKENQMAEQFNQQKNKFNNIIAEYKKFIDDQLNEKQEILKQSEQKDQIIMSLNKQKSS